MFTIDLPADILIKGHHKVLEWCSAHMERYDISISEAIAGFNSLYFEMRIGIATR